MDEGSMKTWAEPERLIGVLCATLLTYAVRTFLVSVVPLDPVTPKPFSELRPSLIEYSIWVPSGTPAAAGVANGATAAPTVIVPVPVVAVVNLMRSNIALDISNQPYDSAGLVTDRLSRPLHRLGKIGEMFEQRGMFRIGGLRRRRALRLLRRSGCLAGGVDFLLPGLRRLIRLRPWLVTGEAGEHRRLRRSVLRGRCALRLLALGSARRLALGLAALLRRRALGLRLALWLASG